MFENFVVFTEVVKLSSIVFHYLKRVNYHDKLLQSVDISEGFDFLANDVFLIEQNVDTIEDEILIIKLIKKLFYYKGRYKTKLLECVFSIVKNLNEES